MQITAIGDTHGRDAWRQIVKKSSGSHFVFLGDYLDPYKIELIEEDDAIENFQELIDFKLSNPNNVTLLIGNHDAQYLFYPKFGTNGKSKLFLMEILDMFRMNKNLFDFAYQKNNYLFTHAGVSNGWFEENRLILDSFGLRPDLSNLAITLNKAGEDNRGVHIFDCVSYYRGGFDKFGSPIWADMREYKPHLGKFRNFSSKSQTNTINTKENLVEKNSPLTGFHQVVGHTKVYNIGKQGDNKTSITFCDCLFSEIKGLTLNI